MIPSRHAHRPCAYPDCKYPELPLTRVCANCRVLQAHHLCQIAFEERNDLDNIPSPYCYNCYRSKENLHVCNSVEEEMPPHIDSGDESDNESVVDANGHESGTVTHQWYNGRPSEVSSPDLSGCVDKVDARVTIQRWARQLGIKAVSYGGDTHKLVMRCGIGGRVA